MQRHPARRLDRGDRRLDVPGDPKIVAVEMQGMRIFRSTTARCSASTIVRDVTP